MFHKGAYDPLCAEDLLQVVMGLTEKFIKPILATDRAGKIQLMKYRKLLFGVEDRDIAE
jgi:hypothetical protein